MYLQSQRLKISQHSRVGGTIKFAQTEQTTNRERTPLTFFRLSLEFNVRMH